MPAHDPKAESVYRQKTFCRICEAHCGLRIESDSAGVLTHILPDRAHPISHGFVCAKGTQFLEVANHPDRLLYPMRRRKDGSFERVAWEDALAYFRDRIRPIVEQYGPHAVALYLGTPAIHNVLGALAFSAFARALGTRNLYSAGSMDNDSKIVAARLVHSSEWIQPIMDLERADLALLLGTNPAVTQGTYLHMHGGTKAYDRLLERGGKLVIVDPRRTESAERWGGHLPIRPGADIFLLLTLIHELRDLYQPNRRVVGLDRLLQLAAEYPAERVSQLTDIPTAKLRELSLSIRHTRRATFFLSVGVNQGPFGTLSAVALQALAYLTGNFDREGGLLFQPWSALLGSLAPYTPQRSRIGNYLANAGGLPAGILADEILTPGKDQIRALIVLCGNPITSSPDETRLRQAFQKLDLLVSIDIFQNQTGGEADLLLPATTWLERFDLGAWHAQYVQAPFIDSTPPMRPAPAETRPEWRILADLSLAAGRPLLGPFTSLARGLPWDSLLQPILDVLTMPFKGYMAGARGIPWPMPKGGTYLRGKRRVYFWRPELESEPERLARYVDEQASLQAENSTFTLLGRRRRLGQNSWIHGAARDGKTEAQAWLCAADMERLCLKLGDDIILSTAVGEIQLPVHPHDGVMPGTVIVPHGLPEVNVNKLISSAHSLIEPLSGMHRMTGNRVQIRKTDESK
jgi:anaerobic selenocysteine-containing dehydrogenase